MGRSKVVEMGATAVEMLAGFLLAATVAYVPLFRFDLIAPYISEAQFTCGDQSARDVFLQNTLPLFTYWSTALVFFVLDLVVDATGQLASWKHIHQGKIVTKIEYGLYRSGIRQQIVTTVVTYVFGLFVLLPTYRLLRVQVCRGESVPSPSVDGWIFFLLRLVAIYALTDVVFYTTHRICHVVPPLYRHVHKLHHKFVDTYGVCASAAHPIEHIFVNLSTVVVPCLVVGVPWHWMTTWLCISSFNTVCGHSGFHAFGFPLCSSVSHDRHHHLQDCEFGIDFLCDRLFGTSFDQVAARRLSGKQPKQRRD